MKYSVPFYQKFKYLDEVDEISIVFKNQNYKLIEFLKKNTNKTVIIEIQDPKKTFTEDWLNFIKEVSYQFKIKIKYDFREFNPDIISKLDVPFFFSNLIDNWDVLYGILKYHPTDAYITNELAFDLPAVSDLLHKSNIQVRVFPNIAQSKFNQLDSIIKFFIRPEDIHHYEGYVDVFEFIGGVHQVNIAYFTYAIKKYWFGPLCEAIALFKNENYPYTEKLDNRMIDSDFGQVRIGCNKRCIKGGSCGACYHAAATAETLRKNKLIIKR